MNSTINSTHPLFRGLFKKIKLKNLEFRGRFLEPFGGDVDQCKKKKKCCANAAESRAGHGSTAGGDSGAGRQAPGAAPAADSHGDRAGAVQPREGAQSDQDVQHGGRVSGGSSSPPPSGFDSQRTVCRFGWCTVLCAL